MCYHLRMQIGKYLTRIRKSKKLSQYQLSNLSGVPRYTIIRIEKDEVEPRISTLLRIAKALEIELFEIIKKS